MRWDRQSAAKSSISAPALASARYLAHRFGADVTGIELTPARVAAPRSTRRSGLNVRPHHRRQCDGTCLPDASQDAVISQEALLHVPDIARAFAEAYRVLRPAGASPSPTGSFTGRIGGAAPIAVGRHSGRDTDRQREHANCARAGL